MKTKYTLDFKHKYDNDDITTRHDYNIDLACNHCDLMGEDFLASGLEGEEPGVEYAMANTFIRNMNILMRNAPNVPILIHMKTCGGDYGEGMAIYDMIKACPSPVTILSYTHARSMSSIILQAANKRVMMPHSYFMYHDGEFGVSGTVKQVYSNVEFNKHSDDAMMKIYCDSMKKKGMYKSESREKIIKMLRKEMDKKEDVFLTAKETIEHGLADEIFNGDWAKLVTYTKKELER